MWILRRSSLQVLFHHFIFHFVSVFNTRCGMNLYRRKEIPDEAGDTGDVGGPGGEGRSYRGLKLRERDATMSPLQSLCEENREFNYRLK